MSTSSLSQQQSCRVTPHDLIDHARLLSMPPDFDASTYRGLQREHFIGICTLYVLGHAPDGIADLMQEIFNLYISKAEIASITMDLAGDKPLCMLLLQSSAAYPWTVEMSIAMPPNGVGPIFPSEVRNMGYTIIGDTYSSCEEEDAWLMVVSRDSNLDKNTIGFWHFDVFGFDRQDNTYERRMAAINANPLDVVLLTEKLPSFAWYDVDTKFLKGKTPPRRRTTTRTVWTPQMELYLHYMLSLAPEIPATVLWRSIKARFDPTTKIYDVRERKNDWVPVDMDEGGVWDLAHARGWLDDLNEHWDKQERLEIARANIRAGRLP